MWVLDRSIVGRLRRALLVMLPGTGLLLALLPRMAAADDPCSGQPNALLGLRCDMGQGVGNVASSVVQFGADQAERALTQWVVDAAVWLLNQLANVILNTSSPDLGAGWWRAHYADLVAVAWVVAPLFLILGVVQAILRADLALFGRILAQLLAVAVFTTGAVALAQVLIGVVDQLSGFVSRNSPSDLHQFLTVFMAGSMAMSMNQPATATVPLAFLFLTGVLTVIAAVLIWLELVARTLVIYAALLFFPVLLAAAIWPQLAHVLRRFVEVLVAVIVSKFIIVVIVAAGVAAVSATGQQGQGPSLVVGAGLLLLAAWAPWKFYHLLPLMEAGALHHFAEPFRGGWHRLRNSGWRRAQAVPKQWTASKRSSSRLPIAGQRPAPAASRSAGAARATGTAALVATAAAAAGAGVRATGGRVATGGGASNGSAAMAGPQVRTGWQPVAGGGLLFVDGGNGAAAPRSNGRPAGGRS